MARRILKDKRVRLAGMVKTFDSEGFPSDGYMPLHEVAHLRCPLFYCIFHLQYLLVQI